MRTRQLLLLAFASSLLLTACATRMEYEIQRDPAADFTAHPTFALESQRGQPDPLMPRLNEAKVLIEQAIVAELEAKGYRQVSENPGFRVEYVVYEKDRFQEGAHDRYVLGESVRLVSGAEPQLANPVALGTLHVHLMDADGHRPLYEGIATGVVRRGEDFRSRIRPAVHKVLEGVPALNNQ